MASYWLCGRRKRARRRARPVPARAQNRLIGAAAGRATSGRQRGLSRLDISAAAGAPRGRPELRKHRAVALERRRTESPGSQPAPSRNVEPGRRDEPVGGHGQFDPSRGRAAPSRARLRRGGRARARRKNARSKNATRPSRKSVDPRTIGRRLPSPRRGSPATRSKTTRPHGAGKRKERTFSTFVPRRL